MTEPEQPKSPSLLEKVQGRFSSIPRHVLGGIRTTTLVLVVLFVAVLVVWNNVRFDPTQNENSPVYVPPATTTEVPQQEYTPAPTRTQSSTTTPSTTGTVTPTPGTDDATPGQTTTSPATTTTPGFQLPTIPGFSLPNLAPTPTPNP